MKFSDGIRFGLGTVLALVGPLCPAWAQDVLDQEARDTRRIVGQVNVGVVLPSNAWSVPAFALSGGAGLVVSRSDTLTASLGLHELLMMSSEGSGLTATVTARFYQGVDLSLRRVGGSGFFAALRSGVGLESQRSGLDAGASVFGVNFFLGGATGYDFRLTSSLDFNVELYVPVALLGLSQSSTAGWVAFQPVGLFGLTAGMRFYL